MSRTTTALRELAGELAFRNADNERLHTANLLLAKERDTFRAHAEALALTLAEERVVTGAIRDELARAREWWHEEPGDQRDKRAVLDWLERCPLAALPVAPTVSNEQLRNLGLSLVPRALRVCADEVERGVPTNAAKWMRYAADRMDELAPTVEPPRGRQDRLDADPAMAAGLRRNDASDGSVRADEKTGVANPDSIPRPPATTRDGGECPPVEAAREVCGTWRGICLSCHGKGYLPNPDFEKGPRCWDCHGTGRGDGK